VTLTLGDSTQNGFSASFVRTNSTEVTLSFTEEQARQLLEAVTVVESYAQTHEIQASAADMVVLGVLRNPSNLPYRVTFLSLATSILVPNGPELPLGNLDFDTQHTTYAPFSMAPGQQLGPVNFVRDLLTLEQGVAAFRNIRGIIIRVGVYELSRGDGRPYVFDVSAIRSRTAAVEIDYGDLRPPERHLVATNLVPGRPGVSVAQALGEILRVPFRCTPNAGLVLVRDIGAAPNVPGRWCLEHYQRMSGDPMVTPYCSGETSFDCSDIVLRAGDVLRLRWNPR